MKVLLIQPGYFYSRYFYNIEALIRFLQMEYNAVCTLLVCDRAVSACGIQTGNGLDQLPETVPTGWENVCRKCPEGIREQAKPFASDVISLKELLDEQDRAIIREALNALPPMLLTKDLFLLEHNGIRIGQDIFLSLLRYLFMGNPGVFPVVPGSICYEYIRSGLTYSCAVNKLFKRRNFDLVITGEVIYVDWGIPAKFALRHGIPVLRQGGGYYHGVLYSSLQLYRNLDDLQDYHFFPKKEEIESILGVESLKEAYVRLGTQKLKEWMTEYKTCRNMQTLAALGKGEQSANGKSMRRCEEWVRPGRKTVIVFLKICWENSFAHGGMLFPTQEEWLAKTFEVASTVDDVDWIFRSHPGEETQYVNPHFNTAHFLDRMQAQYPCEHIRIMDSSSGIRTFDLIPYMHAAVVSMGTAPFELATFGIPCVYAGKRIFSEMEFTHWAESIDEYVQLLRCIGSFERLSPEQRERAQVFAGMVFDKKRFLDMRELYGDGEDVPEEIDRTKMNEWLQKVDNKRLLKRILAPILQ